MCFKKNKAMGHSDRKCIGYHAENKIEVYVIGSRSSSRDTTRKNQNVFNCCQFSADN